MNVSDLLRRHEGERLTPYHDQAGKLTIGVGRNLDAEGIQLDESALMLKNDVNKAVLHLMKWHFYGGLDEVRQAACIDLCFNVGGKGFDEFRDLIAELQAGNWTEAAAALRNSLADHQEPRRIEELAQMLETGNWPSSEY